MQKPTIVHKRACDFCGSGNIRIIKNTDTFSREVFDVLWCPSCELGKTDFQGIKPLQAYYPVAYYGKHDRRFVGLVELLVRWSRWRKAKKIEKWRSGQTKRILDYGCGRGIMLSFLRSQGWSCIGTEYSAESSQYARNLGLEIVILADKEDPIELLQGTFGVITAWHVLEHLPQPERILQRFNQLLEPGGLLFLEVPNFSSFQAKLSREHWIYTECPRHLLHFSPPGLIRLLAQSDFAIKSVKTFSLEYGVFGLLQALLNIFCSHKNLLFYLLRNPSGKPYRFPASQPAIMSLLITAILFVPLFPIAALMEVVLSLFSKGGVVTMVAQKRPN